MPRRDLKESIKTSKTLRGLSDGAFRAFMLLIVTQDDYGRFHGELEVLRSTLYPFGDRPAKKFEREIQELVDAKLLFFYRVRERRYCFLTTFVEHQGAPRAKFSKFPAPESGVANKGDSNCAQMSPDVLVSSSSVSSSHESRVAVEGLFPDPQPYQPQKLLPESSSKSKTQFVEIGGVALAWPSPEALIALYHAEAPDEFPVVKKLTPGRIKRAQQYLALFPDFDYWQTVFRKARTSKFLRGLRPATKGHSRPFLADFDWFVRQDDDGVENSVKVFEDRYDSEAT